MTKENEAGGNGEDQHRSRVQQLMRAWTDTRIAYHATTDSNEKRLLAERSAQIASEMPASEGFEAFMEILEQSLAPQSKPLYAYNFYASDDLKDLGDTELTRAYVENIHAQAATEHVGRVNRLVGHRNQIFQELRRRGVARAAMNELASHADENVRKRAKTDLEWIERAVVPQPESQPPRQLPWQILWQCDHAPPPGLTRDEIAERLRDVLPDACDALMDLALPAIGLWPQRVRPDRATTASRLGGMPWAPADWEWPTVEGEPLLFVGQINCAELRGLPGAELLPSSGLLAVFGDHDAVEACRIEAQGDIAVYHWRDVDHLVPAVAPIEPSKILLECPLAFRPLIDLPDPHSGAIRRLKLNEEQASVYKAEWHAMRRRGFPDDADGYSGFSKLLGWPALVQHEDLFCFEHGTEDARLLLQVDGYCNGEDTQHWGPGGSLYFFISEPMLQEHNFAACEFEIQFT